MSAFDKLDRYEHSGKIPPLGLALALGGSFLGAFVLGWLYTEFICSIPIIYFNAAATAALGYGSGAIASLLVRLGKIRQPDVPLALSMAAAAVALYVAWGHDIAVRGLMENASFTLSPGVIWDYVQHFNEVGAWSLQDGPPVTGPFLWAVWLLETCLVFGAAWYGSQDALENAVYCEDCDGWTQLERGVKQINRDAFTSLVEIIKAGDIGCLAQIVADPGSRDHVRVDLASCATCTESNYVSVFAITLRQDSKGVDRKTERRIVPPVRIAGAEALKFKGVRPWAAAGLEAKPEPKSKSKTRRREREPGEDSETRRRKRRERAPSPDPDEQSYKGVGAVVLHCPHCGKKSRIPPKYAGKRGRCPKCKEEVRVPKR